jgi:hypothetical protein
MADPVSVDRDASNARMYVFVVLLEVVVVFGLWAVGRHFGG